MTDADWLPGTLDMLVMQTLLHGPQHGYEIARFIRTQSRGKFRVIDGALYASLHRLEREHHVASRWGHAESRKRAKFYELTPSGRRALRLEVTRWYRYVVAIARVIASKTEPTVIPFDRPAVARAPRARRSSAFPAIVK